MIFMVINGDLPSGYDIHSLLLKMTIEIVFIVNFPMKHGDYYTIPSGYDIHRASHGKWSFNQQKFIAKLVINGD